MAYNAHRLAACAGRLCYVQPTTAAGDCLLLKIIFSSHIEKRRAGTGTDSSKQPMLVAVAGIAASRMLAVSYPEIG